MSEKITGILVLLAAASVESVAQLLLKIGAEGGPAVLRPACREWATRFVRGSSGKPWIAFGVIAYGLEIILYTFALLFLDLSVAFPLGSLCFVGVALLSKYLLGEAVDRKRWLGIGLIISGAFLVTL